MRRQNHVATEARARRLGENEERQAALKSELEGFGEEVEMLSTALDQSKTESKCLRTSLFSRDRAFSQLRQDLTYREMKRLRIHVRMRANAV